MREIASLDELKTLVGHEVAVSGWVDISQERVNTFADATGDHQWIHLDAERCKAESPYGGPIAHGFLTLSLLPVMMQEAMHISGVRMGVNYGVNKVRFPAAVPVGSRLRGRMQLQSAEEIAGGLQLVWQVTVEREGGEKPVCIAEAITRLYA